VSLKPSERYPSSDILAQRGHWDNATREVVLDRVHNVPRHTFFDSQQRVTLEALCARVLPQTHRPAARIVPIAPWIDQRCARGAHEGFRFDDMPSDVEAWTLGLKGLDQTALALGGAPFAQLDSSGQVDVLQAIRRGDPPGEVWQGLPARRWWVFIALRQITAIYYAHPYAWDEIGFGGPAYPRGYFALNFGAPEPWEARERAPSPPGRGGG
jgi:Gluconate 2-dehydrogenase subunit 3